MWTSYKCACWHILIMLIQMGGIDDQFPALRSLLCNSMDFRSRLKRWRELEPWRKRKGMLFALNSTSVPCVHLWHRNMYGHVSKSTGIVDGWNPALPATWTSDKTCCSLYDPFNFEFDMAGVAGFHLLITSDFTYAGPLHSSKIQGVWRQKFCKVSPISVINSITSWVPLLFLSVSQKKTFCCLVSYCRMPCKRMSAWPKDMILNDATPEISCHLSSMGWSISYWPTAQLWITHWPWHDKVFLLHPDDIQGLDSSDFLYFAVFEGWAVQKALQNCGSVMMLVHIH